MSKETTDFRYNTGATKVPWAAVGEDYNAQDLMEIVKFLMQGSGAEHDAALADVEASIKKLSAVSAPPGKLSLAGKVEALEKAGNIGERLKKIIAKSSVDDAVISIG